MKEQVAVFGEKGSLIGVVSLPDRDAEIIKGPGIILLNSGLLHRVGPNRLYVKIARNAAASGLLAFRFDLSGIGDSPRTQSLPLEQSAIRDTRLAMDYLFNKFGIRAFFIAGICSGADNAFETARIDSRVAGVIMIDGFAYTSTRYLVNSYLKSFLKPRSWKRLFSGESDILQLIKDKIRIFRRNEWIADESFWPVIPDIEIKTGITALVDKGVELSFIFSSGSEAHFKFKKTYAKTIERLAVQDRISVQLFDQTDHLFSPLHIQDKLTRYITAWTVDRKKTRFSEEQLIIEK